MKITLRQLKQLIKEEISGDQNSDCAEVAFEFLEDLLLESNVSDLAKQLSDGFLSNAEEPLNIDSKNVDKHTREIINQMADILRTHDGAFRQLIKTALLNAFKTGGSGDLSNLLDKKSVGSEFSNLLNKKR